MIQAHIDSEMPQADLDAVPGSASNLDSNFGIDSQPLIDDGVLASVGSWAASGERRGLE
jgi:hypothetical protein